MTTSTRLMVSSVSLRSRADGPPKNATRVANHDVPLGNIPENHGPQAYQRPRPDLHLLADCRAGPDVSAGADMNQPAEYRRRCDERVRLDRRVVTDRGVGAEDDLVSDGNVAGDRRAGIHVDAAAKAGT